MTITKGSGPLRFKENITRVSVLMPVILAILGLVLFGALLLKSSQIISDKGQSQAQRTVQQLTQVAADLIQQRIGVEVRVRNLQTLPDAASINQHVNAAVQSFPGHVLLVEPESKFVHFSTLDATYQENIFKEAQQGKLNQFFTLDGPFGAYIAYKTIMVFGENVPSLEGVFFVRQDLLMAPYNSLIEQMQLFTVLGLFILALVGWLMGHFIAVRINMVRQAVVCAEQGEKPEPLTIVGSYEFSRLTEALNLLIQGPSAKDKVRKEANTDVLTGLLNRRGLLSAMDPKLMAGGSAAEMSVMFLDLDGFKPVNDTYGHEVGDDILKEVGLRLTSCVREDDLVCRLGGDEFVILFPKLTDRKVLEKRADRVLAKINEPYWIEDNRATLSVSIGISIGPADGKTGEELLTAADEAMYSSKKTGKNQFTFYS